MTHERVEFKNLELDAHFVHFAELAPTVQYPGVHEESQSTQIFRLFTTLHFIFNNFNKNKFYICLKDM